MNDQENLRVNRDRVNICPACGAQNLQRSFSSVVSPWVMELANSQTRLLPGYKICKECGTGWFELVYSDSILDALYKAYRGKDYFSIRNSWEPSYTSNLNEGLNRGNEWLLGRRAQIVESLMKAGCDLGDMDSVLDFGGGHGGVMPVFPNRFLLEANETVVPDAGIVLVHKLDDAKNLELDLVMCCGVLEHVNFPDQLVKSIMELNADYFLFEVPTGVPTPRNGIAKLSKFLYFASSKKFIWRQIQSIERRVPSSWRRLFPLRCSEHLQFFTQPGLKALLESQGLQILELTETSPNESLEDGRNLGFENGLIAVCKRKN